MPGITANMRCVLDAPTSFITRSRGDRVEIYSQNKPRFHHPFLAKHCAQFVGFWAFALSDEDTSGRRPQPNLLVYNKYVKQIMFGKTEYKN